MKTIASALIALSILAGIAAPASAAKGFNPDDFWTQQEHNLP